MSTVNRRLAQKAEAQQRAVLRATDSLARRIARVHAGMLARVLEAAVAPLAEVRSRVASAVAQAQADTLVAVEQSYPGLVRESHARAARDLLATIPPAWWRVVVRTREDWLPERQEPMKTADELELARDPTIDPDEYKEVVAKTLFKPLTTEQVNRILVSPGHGGMTWQERFRRYTFADQEVIQRELATGLADGEPIDKLHARMLQVVDGVSYKAQRIARTEGRRVAHEAVMEANRALGNLLDGMELVATLDRHTRPEHRQRDGRIYRQTAPGVYQDEAGNPLPQLPDAPNCRCFAAVVIRDPG